MENLDPNIYKKMEELKKFVTAKQKGEYKNNDIIFVGSINWIEKDSITGKDFEIKKDIYISVENKSKDDFIFKYYDLDNKEKPNLLAVDQGNGIIPTVKNLEYSMQKRESNLDFKSQIQNLEAKKGISLNQTNEELDKISKQFDMPKDKILAIANVDLDNQVTKKEEEKIQLKENKEKENTLDENNKENRKEIKKNNPNIKQETDLNQKVNERYTLGDIIGETGGGKLVAVYSDAVENNTNSTKFTFLIKDKDGNFSRPKHLEQMSGTHPTNDVYASNYDGSRVTKTHVDSSYKINNNNYALTVKIGTMGDLDLGLSQRSIYQGEEKAPLMTVPLKTSQTYNTRPEVKEKLLAYHSEHGRSAADVRAKEARSHDDECELTMYEVDGDPETGHKHEDDHYTMPKEKMENMLIKLYEEKQDQYFTYDSFKDDFYKTYLKENFDPTQEEFDNALKRCEDDRPLGPSREARN